MIAASLAWLAAGVWARAPAPAAGIDGRASALVYGADDRRELFELSAATEGVARDLAATSILAMVPKTRLAPDGRGGVALDGSTLEERFGLCPGHRFGDQPSVADCTAVVVGDDLALTAGHCLDALPCAGTALIAGLAYDGPGHLAAPAPAGVFACKEVLLRAPSDGPPAPHAADFAWLRLDRAVARAAPVSLAATAGVAVTAGAPVTMMGFGEGIPLKVHSGATVVDPRAGALDTFLTDLDAFHGASGGPVFDGALRVVGILTRGAADYVATAAGCYETSVRPAGPGAEEEVSYAFRAVDALCRDPARARDCALARGGDPAPEATGAAAGCSAAGAGGSDGTGGGTLAALAALLLLAARRIAGPSFSYRCSRCCWSRTRLRQTPGDSSARRSTGTESR